MIDWYWNSFGDFLAMGGYAPYVWSAFGVTALVIVAELWSLRRRRKAVMDATDFEDDA